MKLIFERTFPYLFGVIAAVLWWETGATFPTEKDLLSATLSVSGIFVGFLATSKAILMTLGSRIVDDLKKSGYMSDLIGYVGSAIWFNLAFCALNVVGYFVLPDAGWYSTVWIGLAVSSLAAFARVTHIMLQVFKYS